MVVERKNGMWDFISVTTINKTSDECRQAVMDKGLFRSVSVSDVFPGVQSGYAIYHIN